MNQATAISLYSAGTSEGACKAHKTQGHKTGSECGGGGTDVPDKVLDSIPRTAGQVNKVLQQMGFEERLGYNRRDAHTYWYGGKAEKMFDSSLGVARPNQLTIRRFVEDLKYKLENDRNLKDYGHK